jgi:hypothetical protein
MATRSDQGGVWDGMSVRRPRETIEGVTSMTRRLRLVAGLTVALVVLLASAGTALAFTTYNDHVLNGGVGGRYYYITSSASGHTSDITGAMWDWIHTTERLGIYTPIYWTRTYTQSASVMDLYYGTYFDPSTGIAAVTEQILNGAVISPYLANWNWGKIKLNTPLFDPLSDYNEKGTVAHEMGHLMGLGHTSMTDQIMCTLGAGRTVNACQGNDCAGINYLY